MKPNFTLFSEKIDFALSWVVIHSLWQATLIALLSGILMVILRNKTAQLRYWVANGALLSVLMIAIGTFIYYFNLSKAEGSLVFIPTEVANNTIMPLNTEGVAEASSNLQKIDIETFKDYFNRNLPLILLIWVMGVAVFLLRLLGGLSYVFYLKKRMNFPADEYWIDMLSSLSQKAGFSKSIDLVESALVRTPMVVGHLKPMILFPMGIINRLSPEEVEAILAHELAHVLRKDYIFNILQSIVEALFYFHPAVWWLSSQIRNERESACDDIAIHLIQSKMNYAKALVAIQEMAYFPLTPALAFAGQRKSQFMIRMQRILNQPNNKTNVMEKLTATCILVFLLISLSFANNMKDNEKTEITEWEQPKPIATDSIPTTASKDGEYNYEDNLQKVKMTVKSGTISQLTVNGLNIPEADIPNFEKLTNKILRKNQPTDNYTQPRFPELIKKPGEEIRLDNLADMIDVSKMGGADVSYGEANDGTMKVQGKDGTTVIIERGDDESQIVTTTDKMGNVSKVITDKNGVTRTENYDRLGNLKGKSIISQSSNHTSVITEDSYGSSNVVKSQRNGKTSIESNENGKITKTYIDGDVVTTIDNEGQKTIFQHDKNGNSVLKYYDKNGNHIETITFKGDKAYLNGREMTTQELNQRGLAPNAYGKGFSKIGGFKNITKGSNTTVKTSQIQLDDDNSDDNDDLQSRIEDLKSDIQDLREEIKDCGCTTNFDFRMGLIDELDRLFPVKKAQNFNVFNAFEKRFLKVKNDWERGECQDFKPKNQGNYYPYKQNNNSDNDAIHVFFQSLIDAGYISLNKSCSVSFNQNSLNIDGKKITGNAFSTIKNKFERLVDKSNYSLNYTGTIRGSQNNLSIQGALSTSF